MAASQAALALAVYDRARLCALLFLLLLAALVIGLAMADRSAVFGRDTFFYVVHQDLLFLPLLFATLLARPTEAGGLRIFPPARQTVGLCGIGLCLLLACYFGHFIVFDGFDLSRDEQMADFDAFIFSRGRLFWPISPPWRSFADALNQTFILPIGVHEAWVSAYLPINAAARALVGRFADPAWTSPLFVALGALSLWRITGRLWPESPSSRLTAFALYACAPQVVITGMTAYAMSGHLGLNLLWLALFLRGGRLGHAGAITAGFFATGLHQPLFHPLFALPFLDLLRRRGAWRLLALYLTAYALITLFWVFWPNWVSAHGSGPVPAALNTEGIGYIGRVTYLLNNFTLRSLWLMAANLLRFFAWQHLFLLPLVVLGIGVTWRIDPIARALAVSFILPVLAVGLLLPYQGHGWGFRYMHGVIGNACLLGGYGWSWLERRGQSLRRPMQLGTAATLLISLPVHATMARQFAEPFAIVSREAALAPAIVIVDDEAAPYGKDVVINLPDLTNRPIRLEGSMLQPADLAPLCRGRSLTFLDAPALAPILELFGRPVPAAPTPHQAALKRAAKAAGCQIVNPK
jgi:hypothetical protein